MTRKKSLATVTIALVAGLVGYIIGPPIVQAATSAVKITSGSTAAQLKISSGKAQVDTEASTVPGGIFTSGPTLATTVDFGLILTQAGGQNVIAQGSSTNAAACPTGSTAIIGGIVVDGGTNTTNATVSITGNTGTAGSPVWQGTVPAGGHIDDTMDGGIYVGGPVAVNVSGSGVTWYLYGLCFGGGAVAKSAVLRGLVNAHQALASKK